MGNSTSQKPPILLSLDKCPTDFYGLYADDIVIHCKSHAQAMMLHGKLRKRLAECKLEMSPSKTKIVYCKDRERTEAYPEISFDFLG
ncbi:MAG: hypothetical protein LBI71_06580, partial [Enterobacteriaceae bacterium]|nr:hypothetical protein [Enterobacteriaceae bacterium]